MMRFAIRDCGLPLCSLRAPDIFHLALRLVPRGSKF